MEDFLFWDVWNGINGICQIIIAASAIIAICITLKQVKLRNNSKIKAVVGIYDSSKGHILIMDVFNLGIAPAFIKRCQVDVGIPKSNMVKQIKSLKFDKECIILNPGESTALELHVENSIANVLINQSNSGGSEARIIIENGEGNKKYISARIKYEKDRSMKDFGYY